MGLSNQGSRVPIKGSIRVAIVWALFFGGGGVGYLGDWDLVTIGV